jgi:hypothetical protein
MPAIEGDLDGGGEEGHVDDDGGGLAYQVMVANEERISMREMKSLFRRYLIEDYEEESE